MEAVILAEGCKMSRRTAWVQDQAIDIVNHNSGKGGGIYFYSRTLVKAAVQRLVL